ncbi:MarR family winged helix-turn-helix transcriptional regulator [Pseudacidovorax sp. NFM-22]|uniref:MarR family winged helix-turn-helix transcriptional regulator n=1 Tax=Pseudacidovorax sp. NFM-22 TaxID=2744469 RepID=UPI001F1CB106|nr:MarR family transcriptional regulator [Pseudacidovorax sp. NFM-22]
MELEDHIFFLCTQVVYRRDRALQDVLRPFGLLTTEWRTLGTLHSRGPMAMQDLAQWTAYERTRLTRMLHGLEERGLVTRGGVEHDGRAVVVAISAKGRRLYARAEKAVSALTDDILSVCPPAEVDRMRAALQAMRERLIEMRY